MAHQLLIDIKDMKKKLKSKLTIAAHHYQRPEVVEFSHLVGDSYKLAVECSKIESKYILFCGVFFMAQGAALLANEDQKVIMPNMEAGCPLASMISDKQAEKAWEIITAISKKPVAPVTYVNSNLDVKDFCGRNNGSVCTSSNAKKVISYFHDKGYAVFFMPDYNLGINTSRKLGIDPNNILKINRDLTHVSPKKDGDYDMFIWDGFCHVHKLFTVDAINKMRDQFYKIKVIVHPESNPEVVKNADAAGSTQFIYNYVRKSPAGSKWAIGTESHFVERLAMEFPDKFITPLQESPCPDMVKITAFNVWESLKSIIRYEEGEGKLEYEMRVNPYYREHAALAIKRMIEITNA